MRQANSAGLVWVLLQSTLSVDLWVEKTSVVDWLNVRVWKNVGWSLHEWGRGEWRRWYDHTIA